MSKRRSNAKIEPINLDKSSLSLKISTMVENGRKQISTKEELEEYPIGSLISYMTKGGIFRKAGFLDKLEKESFVYLSADFNSRRRVKYANIKKIWIGTVYETKNDIVSIIPSENKKTKFFAKIGNVVVYYAADSHSVGRFKHTQKYQRMTKWHDLYGNFD